MYCYVIYYDIEEDETLVNRYDTAGLACVFMEKKLESDSGYKINDFQVINGYPLDLKEVISRKIYLTNAS